MSVITRADAELVIERAQNHCEACGWTLTEGGVFHHRKPRKFGDHSAANLMYVHGGLRRNCHNLHQGSIHSRVQRSERLGHILRGHQDPATVPVQCVANLLEVMI